MSHAPENQVFEYKNAQLHYHKVGNGDKILLAFHGFGQTKLHFHHFALSLRKTYTIYSFDLFYHGMSFWHEREKPLTKEFWKALIATFYATHNIDKCTLAGYSMGGKFVLATLEAFPEKVEKIILIAPDGIKTSFWYSLATYPTIIRKYFRQLIAQPSSFYSLVNVLSKTGLMDKGLLKFAQNQMNTREKRRRVYYSWVVFRLLKFNMSNIASIINKNKIEVDLFLGKYDKMITTKNMQKLVKKLHNFNFQLLESGHTSLINEVTAFYLNSKEEK